MPSGPGSRVSDAALERFSELVARHEAGERVDFELELARPPELERELRRLHQGWLQLVELLPEVRGGTSELRAAVAEAGASPLSLDPRSQRLIELLARFRGSEERYEVLGEVGRGGMSVVLRVRERGLDRELALKRLPAAEELSEGRRALRPQLLRRLLDEAWVLSRLDHPGIVPLHELGVDAEGRVYFTMPLVRGRTLAEIFGLARENREDWSVLRALELLQRVCEALSFAHANGIVHRDLKPANVMVGRFGEVQVMDWGLARVVERGAQDPHPPEGEAQSAQAGQDELDGAPSLTLAGDIVGTPAYMAPEQALGQSREACPRADVYAMGAMLYELLSGVRPYREPGASGTTSTRAMLERIRGGPPAPIESLAPGQPAELLAICRKAMQREREARYPDMLALAADLRAFREGRVVRAFETGAWAELRKWVLRNRRVAGALALTVLTLAGAAIAASLIQSRAEERVAFEASRRLPAALRERARKLWPARAEQLPSLQAWRRDALDLVGRADEFRRRLQELRARALERSEDSAESVAARRTYHTRKTQLVQRVVGIDREIRQIEERAEPRGEYASLGEEQRVCNRIGDEQALDAWREQRARVVADIAALGPLPRQAWSFGSTEERDAAEELQRLLDEIAFLLGASRFDGTLADIESRIETATTLRARSLDSARAEWSAACASIADRAQCPLYEGLKLEPQLGLLPLGRDPQSGLWEFAHLESGAPARRGPDGRLVIEPETGLVFVLVPGGRSTLGVDTSAPSRPGPLDRCDSMAEVQETPRQTLRLNAFLLSKYELTQAQWRRMTGTDPSYHCAGKCFRRISSDFCFPLEHVSWVQAREVLARFDLVLPSEAQWEHAARGGTSTRFWWGDELEDACSNANYAQPDGFVCLEDPWERTARVDSLQPSPWGFHCILGNVAELCLDRFWTSFWPCSADGTGRQNAPDSGLRTVRGGHFGSAVRELRVTFRTDVSPDQPNDCYGLRPARLIDGWRELNAAEAAGR